MRVLLMYSTLLFLHVQPLDGCSTGEDEMMQTMRAYTQKVQSTSTGIHAATCKLDARAQMCLKAIILCHCWPAYAGVQGSSLPDRGLAASAGKFDAVQ